MKKMWFIFGAILFAGFGIVSAAAACTQNDSAPKPPVQESAQEKAKTEDASQESDEPAQDETESVEDYSSLSAEEALAKVEELDKQFNEKLDEFRKKFQAAPAEEKAKLRSEMPKADAWIEKLQKLAELHPNTDAEGKALIWVVQHVRSGPAYDQSLGILFERHADNEELKPVVVMLQYQPPSEKTSALFEKLRGDGTSRDLRAVATYAYLQYQKRAAELKANLAEDEENAERFEAAYGKEQVAFLKQMTVLSEDDLLAELEKLNSEFGDVVLSGERTLAKAVEGDIFEAKFLKIGKEVPDIEGEDIDGTEFKLSDYRGKVVVIDFWGDW